MRRLNCIPSESAHRRGDPAKLSTAVISYAVTFDGYRKRVFFVFCAINTRLFFKNSILRQPLRSLHSNLFFSSFPPLILFPETSSKHPLQNLRDKICDKICNKIHHTGSLPVPIPRDTPISRPLRPCHGFLSATGFAHHPSRGRRTP